MEDKITVLVAGSGAEQQLIEDKIRAVAMNLSYEIGNPVHEVENAFLDAANAFDECAKTVVLLTDIVKESKPKKKTVKKYGKHYRRQQNRCYWRT